MTTINFDIIAYYADIIIIFNYKISRPTVVIKQKRIGWCLKKELENRLVGLKCFALYFKWNKNLYTIKVSKAHLPQITT